MKDIAILGATGSIGSQALDVIERHPFEFRVCALTAHSDSNGLFASVRKFRPRVAGLVNKCEIPDDLRFCEWIFGPEVNERALSLSGPDYALCAIVGVAGLGAVMRALDVCSRVMLANKESLVAGGTLLINKARDLGVELIPVDSEHSAIFQCLAGGVAPSKLILTASGGALRDYPMDKIYGAGVSEVLRHPTWKMGGKITVDCATMMNKGLEVIEAHYLFNMPEDKIEVLVHPQSVVHSMVVYPDGAVMAQLGPSDMRIPIAYAMSYPERIATGAANIDFSQKLTFMPPDMARYPSLKIAREALKAGPWAMIAMNAINEEAVNAFLSGRIHFGAISETVERVLEDIAPELVKCVGDVYNIDARAREKAGRAIGRIEW